MPVERTVCGERHREHRDGRQAPVIERAAVDGPGSSTAGTRTPVGWPGSVVRASGIVVGRQPAARCGATRRGRPVRSRRRPEGRGVLVRPRSRAAANGDRPGAVPEVSGSSGHSPRDESTGPTRLVDRGHDPSPPAIHPNHPYDGRDRPMVDPAWAWIGSPGRATYVARSGDRTVPLTGRPRRLGSGRGRGAACARLLEWRARRLADHRDNPGVVAFDRTGLGRDGDTGTPNWALASSSAWWWHRLAADHGLLVAVRRRARQHRQNEIDRRSEAARAALGKPATLLIPGPGAPHA